MKNSLLALSILLSSVKAFASGPFDAAQDLPFSCPGKEILEKGYTVECRGAKGFKAAKAATVGANVRSSKELGIEKQKKASAN